MIKFGENLSRMSGTTGFLEWTLTHNRQYSKLDDAEYECHTSIGKMIFNSFVENPRALDLALNKKQLSTNPEVQEQFERWADWFRHDGFTRSVFCVPYDHEYFPIAEKIENLNAEDLTLWPEWSLIACKSDPRSRGSNAAYIWGTSNLKEITCAAWIWCGQDDHCFRRAQARLIDHYSTMDKFSEGFSPASQFEKIFHDYLADQLAKRKTD